jgi:glycosyltransferase involved in cell wall biosynthesis
MKIINAMFAKGLGGIEQAFLDYTKALVLEDNQVVCVVHPKSEIIDKLESLSENYQKNIEIKKIPNLGYWDFFAKLCLDCVVQKSGASVIITHGNRTSSLLRYGAKKNKIPLISVAHNYKIQPLLKADYIFSITNHLKSFIKDRGFDSSKISVIPNMIDVDKDFKPKANNSKSNDQVTIGVIARLIQKKGVDSFLKACSALISQGVNFNAIIAGCGEEAERLQKLRDELNLNKFVKFKGWVSNKDDFYKNIDIFCLPSLHEPFGIVILEAMKYHKPIVSSDTEGPSEILENGEDSLIFEKGHSGEMAIILKNLIESKDLQKKLAKKANQKLYYEYETKIVAKTITLAIEGVIENSRYKL